MAPASNIKKKALTPAHKKALAEGRNEGRAVRAYLDHIKTHKPKRGPKRTSTYLRNEIAKINQTLSVLKLNPIDELKMIQKRMNLQKELGLDNTQDTSKLETDFVKVAKQYSSRRGITRAAWLSVGVPSKVLDKAGIK